MVTIMDIKMPVNCEECFARVLAWCRLDEEERIVVPAVPWELEDRPEWCPLVDVPDMNVGNCSEFPNSCENLQPTCNEVATDCVSRQAVLDALEGEITVTGWKNAVAVKEYVNLALDRIKRLPSVQTEQRYTEEELRVFQHGISLSLLSKRSAQHWKYDEDTATEIKFLERLYEKVGADMRGEQDSFCSYAERKTNGSDGDK